MVDIHSTTAENRRGKKQQKKKKKKKKLQWAAIITLWFEMMHESNGD